MSSNVHSMIKCWRALKHMQALQRHQQRSVQQHLEAHVQALAAEKKTLEQRLLHQVCVPVEDASLGRFRVLRVQFRAEIVGWRGFF